jgi:hypothetical protein
MFDLSAFTAIELDDLITRANEAKKKFAPITEEDIKPYAIFTTSGSKLIVTPTKYTSNRRYEQMYILTGLNNDIGEPWAMQPKSKWDLAEYLNLCKVRRSNFKVVIVEDNTQEL